MSKNKSKHKTKSYKNIGILDPLGLNINPLTNDEYKDLYKNQIKTINGEKQNATYANLSKIWSTKKVYDYRYKILDEIEKNQVTLIIAGTGVGKTVLIPKFALHHFEYNQKVITTIPKKIITKKTASFAAECLDVKLGEEVGYYYKGDNKTNMNDKESKLIFTTTGSLISRITGDDPLLKDYKCVIIDEAHERTVQTDQLLLLLKKALQKRSDLKIIIMSATIDLSVFRNYFPKSKFAFGEIDVGSELTHPVEQIWMEQMPSNWHLEAAKTTMNILKNTDNGDILIFGRSGSDAGLICDKLKQMLIDYKKGKSTISKNNRKVINPICVKLAGNSSKEEEDLAIDEFKYTQESGPDGIMYNRKIVIATNVAESSVTIDGIVYVIDSGLEFAEYYYATKMVRSLVEEPASQASITQRKGRAGRTKPGVCYHLYTKKHFNDQPKYPIPNIQKSDITSDILNLMNLDYIKNIKDLKGLLNEFISPPSKELITASLNTLHSVNSITSTDNKGTITKMGRAISLFRVLKVNMSRSIIASYYYGCSNDVINIVACLIQADGRIDNIFMDYKPDKRKNAKENKKEEARYKELRKSFSDSSGDYLTLLNIYMLFMAKKKDLGKPSISMKDNVLDDVDLEDNINEVVKDVINITSASEKTVNQSVGGGGVRNAETALRKWCVRNYINYKKIKYVNILASTIKRKLFDIVRGDYQDVRGKVDRRFFKSYEDKILYCFLIGNYAFTARNTIGTVYKTVFPLEKSLGGPNRSSFFNPRRGRDMSDTIMYDELFMTNKHAKLLKFNMVNSLPSYLLENIKPNIIDTVPELYASIKKLQSFDKGKRQGKGQGKGQGKKKKTFKKKKFKGKKGNTKRKKKMML